MRPTQARKKLTAASLHASQDRKKEKFWVSFVKIGSKEIEDRWSELG